MQFRFRTRKGKRASGKGEQAGSGCLIVFGSVFAGMGMLFGSFLTKQFAADVDTYGWEEVPCEIESLEIQITDSKEDDPFRLEGTYRYQFEGGDYTSNRVALQSPEGDDYEKLALRRKAVLDREPPICYVDPESPSEAVLSRASLLSGLLIFFPLIFVAVGGAIIVGGIISLRKERVEAKRRGGKRPISVSGSTSSGGGKKVGLVFGVIFTIAGLVGTVVMVKGPLKRMVASRGWVETPCEVIWSRVRSHDSDDGTTYSVDIFYEYEFEGETHRSNRYQGMGGSSSGHSGKAAVVREYPKGSKRLCYVNPKLPEQAILVPGITGWALIGLIPVAFFLAGVSILIASLKSKKAPTSVYRPGDRKSDSFRESSSEPLILSPGGGRLVKLAVTLGICLFWNGIVSIFVVEVVNGWRTGNGDVFSTLFMTPFVVIGAGLLLLFVYQVLASVNPRPTIRLPGGQPAPGDSMAVEWEMKGSVSRVVHFKVSLWGIESATYRRGTNTVTTSRVFFDLPVVDTVSKEEMRQGQTTIVIPDDLMHSLKLSNNEIKYEIRVEGEIPLWPDIADQFKVTLLPLSSDPV